MPRFALEDWTAGQLRLTTFVTSRIDGGAEQLWESLIGSQPDESSASPKKGTSQVSGAFEPGKLTLRLEPQRVDWVMQPEDIDPGTLSTDPFFSFGPWAHGLAVFERIAEGWLRAPALVAVDRVAFGSVLLHREESKAAAYERLADYIPVKPRADFSDFLYQINHPVPSATGIEDLRVNRLTKWSVGAFRALGFALGAKGSVAATIEHDAAHALRLELDINTTPNLSKPLPQDRLVDVYRELVGFAREIATNGLEP